jgi:hypothetical protein
MSLLESHLEMTGINNKSIKQIEDKNKEIFLMKGFFIEFLKN